MLKIINTRILLSGVILLAAAGIIIGATSAFFSDTETSQDNTLTAGSIDLKIDNTSYLNGVLNSGTTWTLNDLTNQLFFNFTDIKPGDLGEDTISLHAENDYWLCANLKLTANDDNTCTEPELLDDSTCTEPDTDLLDGELAQNLNFIFWEDDGDNVLETDEVDGIITQGSGSAVLNNNNITLADSQTDPIIGGTPYYIGKAWCFGTLTQTPVAADQGVSPAVNGGVTCDGSFLDNATQTDKVLADIKFDAVQSRNNPDFLCAGCVFDTNLNLVTNGSFETPIVVAAQKWDVFPSVAGGWSVDWRSGMPLAFNSVNRPADPAKIELHRGVLGLAQEGAQYAELDSDWFGPTNPLNGESASTKVYQTITTTPGAQYTLHFAFAPRPSTVSADNNLEVRFGGIVVSTVGPLAGGAGAIVWTGYDVTVTATTTSTELSFTDLGTANSLGTFLDDVRLNQTSCNNN